DDRRSPERTDAAGGRNRVIVSMTPISKRLSAASSPGSKDSRGVVARAPRAPSGSRSATGSTLQQSAERADSLRVQERGDLLEQRRALWAGPVRVGPRDRLLVQFARGLQVAEFRL